MWDAYCIPQKSTIVRMPNGINIEKAQYIVGG